MELQLGPAIPVHTPLKGFDLDDREPEPKELVGSELWNYGGCLESEKCVKNKRSSEEAFGKTGDVPQTLPLMLWNGQPNEDDDPKRQKKSCIINKKEAEENHVVGWPPIKSWMKKQLHQHQGGQIKNDRTAERTGGPNSLYAQRLI